MSRDVLIRRPALAALALIGALATAAPALGLGGADASSVAEDPDAAAQQLAGTITAVLRGMPGTAPSVDLEGQIVYVLSQSDYASPVIVAALNSIHQARGLPARTMEAVTNVRLALLRRKVKGTAALAAGGGGGFGSISGFTPVLGPGGGGGSGSNGDGGSDYSS